jgi:hypothetical protein
MPDPRVPRAEPSVIAGDRLVEDSSVKIVIQMQDEFVKLYKSATPLTVLKNKTKKKRQTGNYEFKWLEVDKYPRRVTLAAGATATATSLTVGSADWNRMAANYTYLNTRTREQVVLTADPTSVTVTGVVRNIGGTAAPMNAGDTLELQAPIHEEGDTLGSIRSIVESSVANYTEIVRTPMGWTGRAANTEYYGGNDPKQVRARTMLEHRISLERRGFFGRKHTRTTSNNRLQTFTGGAEHFIKSHIWDLAGNPITERGLVEWMEDVMEFGDGGYLNGSQTKWLFAGNSLITEIDFFARDKIRYQPLSSKIGFRAGSFHTPHGTLNIVRHPQFTGDHSGWGFVLDLNHIKYVYHKGRDTMLLRNRHARSFDGAEEEYLTDSGWQVEMQIAHGIIQNHRIRV